MDCHHCRNAATTTATTRHACGDVVVEMLCDEHVEEQKSWELLQRELYAQLVAVWDQIDAARAERRPYVLGLYRARRIAQAQRRPLESLLESARRELSSALNFPHGPAW